MIDRIKSKWWFGLLIITLYLSAIVLANYLITAYGQSALPWVAFTLIPFDLVARDLMQDRWQGERVFRKMVWLIFAGAMISWATGTGSLRVSLASLIAFVAAGVIDALTYQRMIRKGRVFRINAATIIAAITDSIIFVTIAFNEIVWSLVGLQIGMKIVGGFVWSLLLYKFFNGSIRPWPPLETSIVPPEADISALRRVYPGGNFEVGGIIEHSADPHPGYDCCGTCPVHLLGTYTSQED